MKTTIKNAPFYLVIVAVMKEDSLYCNSIKMTKGEELAVDQSQMRTIGYDKPDEIYVKRMSSIRMMGFDCWKVPVSLVDFKVKTIIPKFKVGDVVILKKASKQTIPFRISSYDLMSDTIWYQDEWGDKNGYASGHIEDDIRLANEEECERSGWKLERNYSKA